MYSAKLKPKLQNANLNRNPTPPLATPVVTSGTTKLRIARKSLVQPPSRPARAREHVLM